MSRVQSINDPNLIIPNTQHISWWADLDGDIDTSWNVSVTDMPVDKERTAALSDLIQNVRCKTQNTSMPLQNVGTRRVEVHERTARPTWNNWFPSVRVPLPSIVYILKNGDDQWFGLDSANNLYYELSALGPNFLNIPKPWSADSIRIWNLNTPWQEQRSGISGAGVPLWPMVPKPEVLLQGANLHHSLHFVSAGYQAGETVGIARKTDGDQISHPLRAGERLRLRWDRIPQCRNIAERTLVSAMLTEGLILTDKTTSDPEGPGHSIRLPNDARIDIDLDLKITDFEVLHQG